MRRPTYYSDIEEIIGNNKGHLIASSACLGSYLDKLILQWKKPEPGYKEVQKSIGVLKRISDFYPGVIKFSALTIFTWRFSRVKRIMLTSL